MDVCTWLATFQSAEEAARAAFARLTELTSTVAQLRSDGAYTLTPALPDCDLLVLMSLSDGDVCPGFYDDCWRYHDGMPVTCVQVEAWRHMPAGHKDDQVQNQAESPTATMR
jgi:hypothetical protein